MPPTRDLASQPLASSRQAASALVLLLIAVALTGCKSVGDYHKQADNVAYNIIHHAQQQALGRTEPFTIDKPARTLRRKLLLDQKLPYSEPASLGVGALKPLPHWPDDPFLQVGKAPAPATQPAPPATQPAVKPLTLSLVQSLQIAAHNSRSYQTHKEQVYTTALDLDLERNNFRNIFSSNAAAQVQGQPGAGHNGQAQFAGSVGGELARQFENGINITANITADLVKMLTGDRVSASGLAGDATITIPLLRGAGRWIVTEPLTQAQRNTLYAIDIFERYKRTFAVQVATSYFSVLRLYNRITNAAQNYRDLILSARRARRLAQAGRLPQIQVGQAVQDELNSRSRWIATRQIFAQGLDQFKILLGLPTDADIQLDHTELARLNKQVRAQIPQAATQHARSRSIPPAYAPVILQIPSRKGGGPLEIAPQRAIRIALVHRLDLRVDQGKVYDAQRQLPIAANAFLPGLTFTTFGNVGASRTLGQADQPDATFSFNQGTYNTLLNLDLPFNRTAERNQYRQQIINLHASVRTLQGLEDQIKLEVRNALRNLLEARQNLIIQTKGVTLAQRRVKSTNLFLEAGRAQIRDVLDAQSSLISAKNALTAAVVNYRVAELDLQRDMGVLKVGPTGLYPSYTPKKIRHEHQS